MALTPIDLFTPQTSIVGRMLAGGTGIFADAINSVVRSAAGLSDNQVRQERDFLAEQRNQESLAQRRAENTQSQLNADRLFDFSVAKDARDFGFREDQAVDAAYDRERAFDQSKTASEAAAKVRQEELGLSRGRLDLAKGDLELKKEDAKREREFNEFVTSPTLGPQLPGSQISPEILFAEADARQQAAEKINNGPAFMDATRQKAQAKAAMEAEGRGADAPTEAQLRARRAEERTLAKDAEAKVEAEAKELVSDTAAFAPQVPFQELDEKGNFKDQKAGVAAQARDKDPFTYEKLLATSVPKEDFIKRGGDIPEAQKKRRARFWELVNGKAAAPAASKSAASSFISDFDFSKLK